LITGNDLARVLRWGPVYSGAEDPSTLLRDVIDAEEIRLDRWTVVFHPEEKTDPNQAGLAGKFIVSSGYDLTNKDVDILRRKSR